MGMELTDEMVVALRARLGLAENATDEEVLAALNAPPEPVAATHHRPGLVPEGAVIMDASALAALQTQAANGDEAKKRLERDDRDRAIQAAVDEGKIAPSRVKHWTAAWTNDPEGAREALAAMPKNLVPMIPEGFVGDPDSRDFEPEFASLFPPTRNEG